MNKTPNKRGQVKSTALVFAWSVQGIIGLHHQLHWALLPYVQNVNQPIKAKHAVLNVVTRDNPPNLTNKDFTIEDWGRKISHQQEEGKEFQKQLQKYINALRTLTFERSRLLDLLLCGYPSAWGQKDKLKLSKIEQEAAVENCASKLNYDTMSKLNKYALMFPDYRAKINRLDRRRIDLDLQKENYEKVKNSKNLNAQKVQRAKLLVDEEQQIYDDMTNQLR